MSRNDPTIYLGDLSIVAGLTHDGDQQALDILRDIDPDNYQVRDTKTQWRPLLDTGRISVRETLRLENTPRQGRSDFWAEMIK